MKSSHNESNHWENSKEKVYWTDILWKLKLYEEMNKNYVDYSVLIMLIEDWILWTGQEFFCSLWDIELEIKTSDTDSEIKIKLIDFISKLEKKSQEFNFKKIIQEQSIKREQEREADKRELEKIEEKSRLEREADRRRIQELENKLKWINNINSSQTRTNSYMNTWSGNSWSRKKVYNSWWEGSKIAWE